MRLYIEKRLLRYGAEIAATTITDETSLSINAGISKVVIRNTKTEYSEIDVSDWIENDDSLSGVFGY